MATTKIWYNKCFVTIATAGGANVEFAARTKDINFNGGDATWDMMNVNSGQIAKANRQDAFELAFDNMVPVMADDFRVYKEGGVTGTGAIAVTSGTKTDTKFRVAVLWTNLSTASSAANGIPTGSEAYRVITRDCYMTKMEEKWSPDDNLVGNMTFWVPAVDSTGGGNVKWESTTGGVALTSLSAYTAGAF